MFAGFTTTCFYICPTDIISYTCNWNELHGRKFNTIIIKFCIINSRSLEIVFRRHAVFTLFFFFKFKIILKQFKKKKKTNLCPTTWSSRTVMRFLFMYRSFCKRWNVGGRFRSISELSALSLSLSLYKSVKLKNNTLYIYIYKGIILRVRRDDGQRKLSEQKIFKRLVANERLRGWK